MAGNENSGGYRPDAPQNNPANINGLGGNGQSGMNTDYTGFAYGENKAINEQRKAAPMPTTSQPSAVSMSMPGGSPLRDLFSESMNDAEPVTNGAPIGPGANDLSLPPAFRSNSRAFENQEIAQKYLPFLVAGTQIPGAPDSYKQFVSYVEGMMWPSRG